MWTAARSSWCSSPLAFGPALAAMRSGAALLAVRLTIVVSVAIAALGTVALFAGEGQSGFEFGSAAFGALARPSPIQAALDVLLLIVEIALVLWLAGHRLLPEAGSGTSVLRAFADAGR